LLNRRKGVVPDVLDVIQHLPRYLRLLRFHAGIGRIVHGANRGHFGIALGLGKDITGILEAARRQDVLRRDVSFF